MKRSAGILLYRSCVSGIEVLLVHPSGNYNKHAPWSIPKGEPDESEPLEDAARRELAEETGVEIPAAAFLGKVTYTKSRKEVFCYCARAPENTQPCCASWEVDQACFVSVDKAQELLHPDQRPLLALLLEAFKPR